ncbi:MAG TPA: patatin-like phospholipase family protein [Stellaceae bacterium]
MQHMWTSIVLDGEHSGTARRPSTLRRLLGLAPRRRVLSLALQGGGSFGAFTWGVLDALLEDESIAFDAVSGTSAGAINAVVFANGLAEGGPAEARKRLTHLWKRLNRASPLASLGSASATSAAIELSTRVVSPYQFNPLGVNLLRDILAQEVDFARLRKASPVRLLIAATRVKDGRLRIFRENEITLEAVLASSCLPQLHHAVEIDGEWYWDGAFSANPPLRQLVIDSATSEIVLVQITPEQQEGVPRLSSHITRRASQIAFNSPLQKEIEGLDDLCALCKESGPFRPALCRKLERLRLHRIIAEDSIDGLHQASAMRLDWSFLAGLRDSGYAAAEAWLARGSRRKFRQAGKEQIYKFAI